MSKVKIIDKKSEKSINSERAFLSKLHHPFIVNMHYAFQDNDNLYLVMDMLSGGDLRYHIARHRKFSEEQTRFFIACMIIALEYIHSANVIHRDIKPENLVLDDRGYVRVTDFGIAKENCEDNSSETSGTPGYMSPEVMQAMHHSFEVDFFALGVIGYEFMKGRRPYVGKNRKEIKEQILSEQAELKKEDIVNGWSDESAAFINKLLIRKYSNRLGYANGIRELIEHSWLRYYPWKELREKQLPSPFIPEQKDNFDRRYCESVDIVGEETKMRYEEILFDDNEEYRHIFKDFYFNKDDVPLQHNELLPNTNDNTNNNTNSPLLQHTNTNIKQPTTAMNNHNKTKKGFTSTSHNSSSSNLSNCMFNNINNCRSIHKAIANPSSISQRHLPKSNNTKYIKASPIHKNSNTHNNAQHRQLSHSYSTKIIKPHAFNSKHLLSPNNNKPPRETQLFYLFFNKPSLLNTNNHNKNSITHYLSRGNSSHTLLPMKQPKRKLKRSASLVDTLNNKHSYYMNKHNNNNHKSSQGHLLKKVNRMDQMSMSKSLLKKVQSLNVYTHQMYHNSNHTCGKRVCSNGKLAVNNKQQYH